MSHIYVVSGPSGAGKTTLVAQVVSDRADAIENVSHTTRPMREGETNAIDYHFRTIEDFKADKAQGKFIESFTVFNNHYGTAKADLENAVNDGKNVFLILDCQGALEVKRLFGKGVTTVFIVTPNEQELKRRLEKRATDDSDTINKRLSQAKHEISQADKFDHIIVNSDIKRAVQAMIGIIDKR